VPEGAASTDAGAGQATDVLAELAAVLRERLDPARPRSGLEVAEAPVQDSTGDRPVAVMSSPGVPSVTPIRVRPSWVASKSRQLPAAWMSPVLIPAAPG
jgi:hypothetical protein